MSLGEIRIVKFLTRDCHKGKLGIVDFVIRDCQNCQIVIGNLLKYGHIGKVESVEFRDCWVLSKKVECVNFLVIL